MTVWLLLLLFMTIARIIIFRAGTERTSAKRVVAFTILQSLAIFFVLEMNGSGWLIIILTVIFDLATVLVQCERLRIPFRMFLLLAYAFVIQFRFLDDPLRADFGRFSSLINLFSKSTIASLFSNRVFMHSRRKPRRDSSVQARWLR